MKKAILLLCLGLIGCCGHTTPVSSGKTTNKDVQVETLFTDEEGYTVKRFTDNYRDHYYVVPTGDVVTSWTEARGRYYQRRQEVIPNVCKPAAKQTISGDGK